MLRRLMFGTFVVGVLVSTTPLGAQLPRPLGPVPERARLAPFFDGWYQNPDGTVSFAFGYSNLNKETIELPIGPDNIITPKEYDGRQPTSFPHNPHVESGGGGATTGIASVAPPASNQAGGAAAPADGGGSSRRNRGAGGRPQYDRERGVFTVTVPGTFKGDVVWTLRYQGQSFSVPARGKSTAYQLSWPMAMGSTPPLLRFVQTGPAGRGPTGIQGPAVQGKVGTPVPLTVWVTDDAVHEKEPVRVNRKPVPSMNVTWIKHAGPSAPVEFSTGLEPVTDPQGKASATATFTEPGDYTIRVKVDAHGNIDSTDADQCCWTNGFVKVNVSR